jgi:hypothetical protein
MYLSEFIKILNTEMEKQGDIQVEVLSQYHDYFVSPPDPKIVYDGFTPILRIG